MSYLGIPPFGRTSRTVTEVVAASGQTTFYPTGGYTVGYIDVVLNGIQLNTTDFTATDGLAVVLLSPAAVNDELHFTSYTVNFVEVDPSGLAVVALSGSYTDLTNKPTTISGYGITDAQPLDADLTAIAALTGTTGLLKKTAANTWTLDTSAYLTGITSSQVTGALGFTPYNSSNPAGYISGNQTVTFSGDASGSGTTGVALTLANSGVAAGTYGSTTNIPQIAVDAKGRITDVTNVAVSIPSGSITFTGDVTGTGTTGSSTALTLANSGVVSGTYTKTTVDAKGRVTSGTTLSASDIPSLDASKITGGTIDAARLPSYVDDVLEYANLAGFPASGETGKIYVALDTNKTYRWSGSAYVYITSGAVDSVAGRTGVVTLTSADVGLANVENKSSATIRSEISSANVTGALGFTPYNSTNPSGYITGITSANVTGALGFTPYSSTNPSGYISGITSANVTTALGYTPYNATNPSGYITSSALSSYLPLTGGSLTGSLSITGNASYVGNWGYSTLVLQDAGGYPGLNFRSGSSNWIFRMEAGGSTLNWAYSSNASGQGTGLYTEYLTLQPSLLTHPSSIRSPVFYDSGDTSYYIDPASQSLLNRLKVSGGNANEATQIIEASIYPMLDFISTSTDTNNRNWRIAGVYNSYGLLQILSGTSANAVPATARLGINGSSGYVGIGAAAIGPANHFQIGSMGSTGYSGNHIAIGNGTQAFAQYLNGATSVDFYTNSGYFNFDKYIQAANSMRAPVFYDSGDTGYYLDPASSSVLNTIYQAGVYTRNAAGTGYLSGNYSSSETSSTTGAIYTIGGSYVPTSTSFGIMYGIGYCYAPGISVGISGADNWGMYVNGSGINNVWLGGETGQVISTGEHRGTIFYDYNDTSYYIDPNSSSKLYSLGLGGATPDTRLSVSGDSHLVGVVHLGGTAGSVGSWGSRDYTTSGIRYFNASSYDFNNYGYGSNYSFLINGSYAQHSASVRAPIFYDQNDTGYYIDPDSSSVLSSASIFRTFIRRGTSTSSGINWYSSGYTAWSDYMSPGGAAGSGPTGNITAPSGALVTSWGLRRFIESAANYGWTWESGDAYTGAPSVVAEIRSSDGMAQFNGGVRSPIFYDSDNTGYYIDPSSTSDSALRMRGGALFGPNTTWSAYLAVGGNGDWNTAYASVATTNGNLHLDAAAGGSNTYINYYAGGAVSFGNGASGGVYAQISSDGSFRSPIFYDYNDTSYYVDPNTTGTSINVAGAIVAGGNVTAFSDERLKTNWQTPAADFVEKLAGILSGTFTRTDTGQRQAGVGAQSLQPLLPEAVIGTSNLSVAYGNAAMVSAVELAKRVLKQDQKIAELTQLVQKLLDKE